MDVASIPDRLLEGHQLQYTRSAIEILQIHEGE